MKPSERKPLEKSLRVEITYSKKDIAYALGKLQKQLAVFKAESDRNAVTGIQHSISTLEAMYKNDGKLREFSFI